MKNRRDFLRNSFGRGAGLAAAPRLFATPLANGTGMDMDMDHMSQRAQPGGRIVSVETPDVAQLPWRMANGAKEFHLIAEPVQQELIPGKIANLWGYNGSAPGPTIQVNQGDRVRIIVDNHLPEPTSMHCTDLRSRLRWTGRREVVKIRFHPAAVSFMSSRCIRQERFSTTRTWRCKK
jgi:manganese oxidase